MTSQRLTKTGTDKNTYAAFVEKTAAKLQRAGETVEQARQSAENICAMYRHHFRELA